MVRHLWKIVLAVVLGCIVFVWFIQPAFVSSFLSKKMNLSVSLNAIKIRPSQTFIANFQINNPINYGGGAAFRAAKTNIYYHYKKLFNDPVEIDEIVLDDVYLNIILPSLDVSNNNWTAIGAKMPESKGGGAVLIRKLVLNQLTVRTEGKGASTLKISGVRKFNRMEFHDINSEDGFPTKELARRIFQDAGVLQYLQQFLSPQNLPKTIDSTIKLFKLFSENEDHS